MNVLVACEFSGTVRRAFREAGYNAWSVDLLPSDDDSPFHIQDDVRKVIEHDWDDEWHLMIAHPPCTHLAVSGARWFKDKLEEQQEALDFVQYLMDAPIPRIAIENPVSIISSRIRKPDQYIQPYQFGHGEQKKTGLWLKNLPLLEATDVVAGREQKIWKMGPSEDRWKERSKTYPGIAKAMAEQWGSLL